MNAPAAIMSALPAVFFSSATIAGPSETIPIPYSFADAHRGAQLRAEAEIVIPIVYSVCGYSPAMQPVVDRYREFETKLNPRQRLDLEIARADFDYQMSLADIACPEFDAQQTLEYEELQTAIANSVLDRMDRLVEQPSGQEE